MNRPGHRASAALVSAVGLLAIVAADAADRQPGRDRVVLQTTGGSGRTAVSGTILDYTGTELTIRTSGGNSVRVFPASQVVDVETSQTEPHIKGLAALGKRQFDEARASLEEALEQEQRTWVRREILAMLVRCALQRGDYASASTRFVALARSDPKTRHFHLIPLVWGPRDSGAGLTADARQWLSQDDDPSKLLGASLLLEDPAYAELADAELKRLAVSANRSVRQLAEAQSWRRRLQSRDLSPSEIDRWEKSIEQIDEPLRGGAHYLVGRARLGRGEHEPAARALLWLPLVYDHDHHLAARACLEAADALAESGRVGEAVTLYQEVTVRFAETAFAKKAAAALKKLAGTDSPAE